MIAARAGRWLVRTILSLAAILAILVIGEALSPQFKALKTEVDEQFAAADPDRQNAALAGLQAQLPAIADAAKAAATGRLAAAENWTLANIDRHIVAQKARADDLRAVDATASALGALLAGDQAALLAIYRGRAELAAIEAEIAGMAALRSIKNDRLGYANAVTAARQGHDRAAADVAAYRTGHPLLSQTYDATLFDRHLLPDSQFGDLPALTRALDGSNAAIAAANRNLALFDQAAAARRVAIGRVALSIADLQQRLGASRSGVVARLQRQLPAALFILISLWLVPVAIKLAMWFGPARWVEGRPAVRIMPGMPGAILIEGRAPGLSDQPISAVSKAIAIEAGDELLVHQDYVKSLGVERTKDTKYLFSWRFPIASLVAGLARMTRVRPLALETVVVGSLHDAATEVALITIPAGNALVFHPRNLIGIVQNCEAPMRIESRWRLASLHAWLTLQLRFLVFHGPGTLIASGARGVRIEPAGSGRSFNQAATIGFSAGLGYAVRRTDTFDAYLSGAKQLFNDTLTGGEGYYIYAEFPGGQRGGITGRGLEGLIDAGLKVFGI